MRNKLPSQKKLNACIRWKELVSDGLWRASKWMRCRSLIDGCTVSVTVEPTKDEKAEVEIAFFPRTIADALRLHKYFAADENGVSGSAGPDGIFFIRIHPPKRSSP